METEKHPSGIVFVITEVGTLRHRRPILPGTYEGRAWVSTDLSNETDEVREACIAAWTTEVVAAYQASVTPPSEEEERTRHVLATRSERDRLLKESDWTQLPDAPVDQARWAIYRQALRDLDMSNPDWPQKPEGDVSEDEKLRVERVLDRAARTILFDGKNKA